MCNKSYKQGRDACNTGTLPKDKLERLVMDQIKEKVLTQECLEELVKLVNEELDSALWRQENSALMTWHQESGN